MNKSTMISIMLFFSVSIALENSEFRINESASSEYSLEFSLGEFEIEEKEGGYKSIKMDINTGTTGIIGMPKLPVYSSLIMVDPTKSYRLEYSVVESHFIENISIVASVAKRRFMIHLRSFLQMLRYDSILCQLVVIGKVGLRCSIIVT